MNVEREMIWNILLFVASISAIVSASPNVATEIDTVFREMNKLRQERGVPPLCLSAKLSQSARIQSLYQAKVGQMTHDNVLDIAGRMLAVGFAVKDGKAAENVGRHSVLNGKVMAEAWRKSPSHYENIINDQYNFVGISVVQPEANQQYTNNGDWYWTVHFAAGTDREVCSDPNIASIVNASLTGGLPPSISPTPQPSSSVVLEINSLIQSLISKSDSPTAPPTPIQITTLTQNAVEFHPPTITSTSFVTISMISTVLVPTTILSVVTLSVSPRECPAVSCPTPLPCICPQYPQIDQMAQSSQPTIPQSVDLSIIPTMAIPPNTNTPSSTNSSSTPTATVLVLSNTNIHLTTTIPPNTRLGSLTNWTVYRCTTSSTDKPTTSNAVTQTVYECPKVVIEQPIVK